MNPTTQRKVLLVPTDMSAASQAAVAYAANLARTMGGTLVLLHVLSPAVVKETAHERYVDKQLEDVRIMLRRWFVNFIPEDARQGVQLQMIAAVGHPVSEILAVAEALRAEMIVMATHGRRGLRRAVYGSVAEAVLRNAPCPVLAVRVPSYAPAAPPLREITLDAAGIARAPS